MLIDITLLWDHSAFIVSDCWCRWSAGTLQQGLVWVRKGRNTSIQTGWHYSFGRQFGIAGSDPQEHVNCCQRMCETISNLPGAIFQSLMWPPVLIRYAHGWWETEAREWIRLGIVFWRMEDGLDGGVFPGIEHNHHFQPDPVVVVELNLFPLFLFSPP